MKVSRSKLFEISYFFVLIKSLIYNSYLISDYSGIFSPLSSVLNYTAVILLSASMLIWANKRFKHIIITSMLLIFFIYIFIQTNATDLLLLVLFIVNSYGINKDRILKSTYKTLFVGTSVIVLLSLIGIINHYELEKNGIIVKSYGFVHPNGFSITVLTIVLLYLYLNYKKKHFLIKLAMTEIIYVAVAYISGCRTSMFVSLICFILMFYIFINKNAFKTKIAKTLLMISPFFAAIFSYLGGYFMLMGYSFMNNINTFFSDRFFWISKYLSMYQLKLFGQKLETSNRLLGQTAWTSVDNSYISIGLNYGLIFLTAFCLLMCLIIYYSLKRDDKIVVVICLAYILIGISENIILSITTNFVLLYAGDIIYSLVRSNKYFRNLTT